MREALSYCRFEEGGVREALSYWLRFGSETVGNISDPDPQNVTDPKDGFVSVLNLSVCCVCQYAGCVGCVSV